MTASPQDSGALPVSADGADESADEQGQEPAHVGRNDLGRIEVSARAVEKIASLAATEIPDAGGVGSRLLGRPVPGLRKSKLSGLPKVSADVDGELVFLDVELSVRWPSPLAQVTESVRQHLFQHVGSLVGLQVREVNIEIVDLITEVETARVS